MSAYLPGPLTYFVGNADGKGLVRIETAAESPLAGEHVASLTRNRESDAAEIVRRWNAHETLLTTLESLLPHSPGDGAIRISATKRNAIKAAIALGRSDE